MEAAVNEASYKVYNASAGSGKTYSLVNSYLEELLRKPVPDGYRKMLAITFTNKAVGEMKGRIINYLRDIAFYKPDSGRHQMMDQLCEGLGLTDNELVSRAQSVLHHLLHHYAGFSVETIDGFNHRLIRTFSRDLKIASNFEVSLDIDDLLSRAVDRLVEKTGEDRDITRVLVDFSMQKADDDRSWDITRDISQTARILFSDNDRPHVDGLKGKTLDDFTRLQDRLSQMASELRSKIRSIAIQVLSAMKHNQLPDTGFTRQSYPNFFKKLEKNVFSVSTSLAWQRDIRDNTLYTKSFAKNNPEIATVMDQMQESFAMKLEEVIRLLNDLWFVENVLSNLTPLSVINLVREEIEQICKEENILPIADFNERIYREIRNQPAPYIYERLGDRYRYFYIDEFQDTSVLQWANLIPLIDNALSQQFEDGRPGSLMLVGDAKQAIYRWRGGMPEQFIELYQGKTPFNGTSGAVVNLTTNWRSHSEVIAFNNAFFSFLANIFGDDTHRELYRIGNRQKTTDKSSGYVQLSFVESNNKDDDQTIYAGRTVELVKDLLNEGFRPGDICVLTRKRDQGVVIGTALMEQQLPVVSSETLLIAQSPLVRFLVNLIRFKQEPYQEEVVANLLLFLHNSNEVPISLHDFLSQCKGESGIQLSKGLAIMGSTFDLSKAGRMALYQYCEYAIDAFNLNHKADACTVGFMNMLLTFENTQKKGQRFLDLWERKKEEAAIAVPGDLNAVNIMTIHKAKGLEFPVVIYPFADEDLYADKSAKIWYDISDIDNTFKETLVSVRKDEFPNYSEAARQTYQNRRNILELDNVNLLYVAFTRPRERLYVMSRLPGKDKQVRPTSFNTLLAGFLDSLGKWDNAAGDYTFGLKSDPSSGDVPVITNSLIPEYRVTLPESMDLTVASAEAFKWLSDQEQAILTGNELHDLMARIKRMDQAEEVFDSYLGQMAGPDRKKIVNIARAVIGQTELSVYFTDFEKVEVERELLSPDGDILRPDRINFNLDKTLTVIDYKTGLPRDTDKKQLNLYSEALSQMGYSIRECLLIYASADKVLINKL